MPSRRLQIILASLIIAAAASWYLTRTDPLKVRVAAVETGVVESTVANTRAGTVNSCRRARLAPAIGGQIASLPVKEGDVVKHDQILLELWNEDLKARVTLAEREAVAARARSEEACVTADVARREADRQVTLHKRNLVSSESMEKSVGIAKSTRAACKAARATAEESLAQVDVAKAGLDRTQLRAPFDGIIVEINGELGEFATPSPLGVPTLPAIDMVDNTCMYVTAPIDEVDAAQIRAGMTARISLDAFKDRHFDGSVRRVASYVLDLEKQARTVDIEADFLKPDEAQDLLPGYSADIEVILDVRRDVLRIPTESVVNGNEVILLNPEKETLERRTIVTGISNWQFTQVVSGLKEGDWVVTSVDREGVMEGARAVRENTDDGN
jgi:HlyD family secretion protein